LALDNIIPPLPFSALAIFPAPVPLPAPVGYIHIDMVMAFTLVLGIFLLYRIYEEDVNIGIFIFGL
jgi:hypothetical protein